VDASRAVSSVQQVIDWKFSDPRPPVCCRQCLGLVRTTEEGGRNRASMWNRMRWQNQYGYTAIQCEQERSTIFDKGFVMPVRDFRVHLHRNSAQLHGSNSVATLDKPRERNYMEWKA
jgi:hypothetical protein